MEEPVAMYGPTAAQNNDAVLSSLMPDYLDEKPEGFDACYARLKTEADEKFGTKELMTVDEYFGKLWYIVNAYYNDIETQDRQVDRI